MGELTNPAGGGVRSEVPDAPVGEVAAGRPRSFVRAARNGEIVRGEPFGPVLLALPFNDEGEAVRPTGDTPYGPASSVRPAGVARALCVSGRLDVGVTWMNDHPPSASEAPCGGVEDGGLGEDVSQGVARGRPVIHHLMIKHQIPEAKESFRPS
ncbi:aldehyde dehydrogenase family protein [Streptosporangium sp. NPDC051022]|uniref:aldehyde dehydrogenase family protein n=1 Tax=Streptosporangium sp. NPDC051022 TaxID=3155752 RepID=UPI003419F1DA